jgi:hypothetical protein
MKDPVRRVEDLYERYPDGGETGWFSFVQEIENFVYWNKKELKWKPIRAIDENIESIRYIYVLQEKLSMGPGEVQKVKVTVYDGYNRDVTDEFRQLDVERDSGDFDSDELWNDSRGKNMGFHFELTWDDLNFRQDGRYTEFKIIARERDNIITDKIIME